MTQVVIGTRTYLGPEWTHVDADPTPLRSRETGLLHPVDVVCDAEHVRLPDNHASLVFSSECLEHFSWRKTGEIVKEWCRIVAPGGMIRIEVPDFLAACKQVLDADTLDMDLRIQQIVFAEQLNQWDYHYAGITHRTLPHYLQLAGMNITGIWRGWEVGWLRVEAVKP